MDIIILHLVFLTCVEVEKKYFKNVAIFNIIGLVHKAPGVVRS